MGPEGLTSAEAARRWAIDGPNELPGHGPRGLAKIARDVLSEPMFLLLSGAAAIYMALGDFREASALVVSLVFVLAITVLQERRTEHALARLRDLSSPRALVIRDGIERRIPGRDVVVGDLIALQEGDRVPADGQVQSATALSVDEAILSGESLPVDKRPRDEVESEFVAVSRVYSGSLVVRGFGVIEITAVGAKTEIGKIGAVLKTLSPEPTPLYREVRRIVRWAAVGGLTLCTLIAVFYAIARQDWLGGVLAGITMAMGILPEEFPVVLTVFLAMGAWRISRVGVLTRRMPAIEAIGAVTVLALDKTGTLTQNKMQVAVVESEFAKVDLRCGEGVWSDDVSAVLDTALAASERNPFDAMERAIHDEAAQRRPTFSARLDRCSLVKEYDLTPDCLAVTHVWRMLDESALSVAVKGAPETVFELCRIEPARRAMLVERIRDYTQDGLRVIAVARGRFDADALPYSPRGFSLDLLGLICLADPLRSSVPATLAECHAAGIRVVMITGDHPGTAMAIALQAGFDTAAGVLTGKDLESLSDYELNHRVRSVNIYARAKPEHKLRLVKAFKANGEVVAMSGDGVNDAPALKAAHIGVAMGERGTDVAREAAALVLVNDDFASLVSAVRLGRRIYANIRHAMTFIVAVHVPIAGLGLLPVLLDWPLIFYPMHVLFLEFVIDPACAFVFESDSESPDIMKQRPRNRSEPLFSRGLFRRSLSLGAAVLLVETAIYTAALTFTDASRARALVFMGLVAANVTLIFVSRSRTESLSTLYDRPNTVFWWIAFVAMTALITVTYLAPVGALFSFAAPSPIASIGVVAVTVFTVLLCARRQRIARPVP